MKALGVIEVSGVVAALEAVDAMLKAADVEILSWEKKLGGRLVSVVVAGPVSAVQEAVLHGERRANEITKTVAKAFINNPHEEVMKIIEKSASKYPTLTGGKQGESDGTNR